MKDTQEVLVKQYEMELLSVRKGRGAWISVKQISGT